MCEQRQHEKSRFQSIKQTPELCFLFLIFVCAFSTLYTVFLCINIYNNVYITVAKYIFLTKVLLTVTLLKLIHDIIFHILESYI